MEQELFFRGSFTFLKKEMFYTSQHTKMVTHKKLLEWSHVFLNTRMIFFTFYVVSEDWVHNQGQTYGKDVFFFLRPTTVQAVVFSQVYFFILFSHN